VKSTSFLALLLLQVIAGVGNARAAGTLTIVSAASYRGGPLAQESIASAFGTDLANAAGTQVAVTDSAGTTRPAMVFYMSATQVNFQIPPGTALGAATVKVTSGSGNISQTSINVVTVAPGLFTTGILLVVTAPDGSQKITPITFTCPPNAACIPLPVDFIPAGSTGALVLWGTGIRGRSNLTNVTCVIGGTTPAIVFYAGPAPDYAGLDQVNVTLPLSLSGAGTVDVVLTVDGQTTNPVTITLGGTSASDRATRIVSQMTLDEKIQQLHGIQDANNYRTVPGIPRLGIPALNITNGPAGVTNGGPGHQGPATALPAPISLAATWDIDLARQYGAVIGKEAKALANGFLEGPDINIARVPQNGRSFEALGEDPFLAGQISAGHIAGIQSQGVIAEAKHYAGNNQEANRTTINDLIDERTLHEIYLPAFEASVNQGRAGAVMCAYNKVNDAYSCENDVLMNQILKRDWGFTGFITSDFGAVHSTVPSAMAGLDLEMPTGIYFTSALSAAVQSGQVPMSAIDDKLTRRYAAMIRFGIFDNPPANQPLPTDADGAIARQIAAAGMVLLKNAGPLLPLDPSRLHSIALIGPYASKARTGGGGSSLVVPAYTVDPMAGLQARAGSSVSITLATGTNLQQAVTAAQSADVTIVMVGDDETEGSDHGIALTGNQDQLVQSVAAANPRTVVVLKSGSAVLMPWAGNVPAILEAWYPGEEDGNAVAAVLFGDVNPSGRLPVTFPANLADLPANTPAQYPGVNGVANYSEGVFVGYRHFDADQIDPLFPFGHGLSYTSFSYRNMTITPVGDTTIVECDVTNEGGVAGAEVAQLYVGLAADGVPEPPKQLKAFQKIALQPHETGRVHLTLDSRAFSYWDPQTHQWVKAPGPNRIMLGSSSRDIRLTGTL
jgi:beta-glucosidase